MLGFHDLSASLSRPNFCDREIIQLSFLKCKVDRQQSPTVNGVKALKIVTTASGSGHLHSSQILYGNSKRSR